MWAIDWVLVGMKSRSDIICKMYQARTAYIGLTCFLSIPWIGMLELVGSGFLYMVSSCGKVRSHIVFPVYPEAVVLSFSI